MKNRLYLINKVMVKLNLLHIVQDIQFGWKHIMLAYSDQLGTFKLENNEKIIGFKLFNIFTKEVEIEVKRDEYSKFYIVDNSIISTANKPVSNSY